MHFRLTFKLAIQPSNPISNSATPQGCTSRTPYRPNRANIRCRDKRGRTFLPSISLLFLFQRASRLASSLVTRLEALSLCQSFDLSSADDEMPAGSLKHPPSYSQIESAPISKWCQIICIWLVFHRPNHVQRSKNRRAASFSQFPRSYRTCLRRSLASCSSQRPESPGFIYPRYVLNQ